jgi:hypothetical protein
MRSDIQEDLHTLGSFVDEFRKGSIRRRAFFRLAVKASLARAFDLAAHVHIETVHSPPFFLLPSLRGICEDLIVLGFAQRMTAVDRDELIANLMILEVDESVKTQSAFFRSVRPDQPVLSPPPSLDSRIDVASTAVRAIWARYGWTLTRGTMPQVRQIAERQGASVLAILYDYLYSLSSGMVHFRPGVLLRLGWGTQTDFTFGVRQFHAYDRAVIETYSIYLLCLYFEVLGRVIRPSQHTQDTVANLREFLLSQERWPELVTFEEMNLKPPDRSILRLLTRAAEARARKRRKFLR